MSSQPPDPPTRRSPTVQPPTVADMMTRLAQLERELAAERRLRVTVASKSIPPPPSSTWKKAWGPAAVAAAIVTVLGGWFALSGRGEVETGSEWRSGAGMEVERELRGKLQDIRDDVHEFVRSERDRRIFEDAAFCELGVLPPNGCPRVRMLPRPHSASTAKPIQPAVTVQPLPDIPEAPE